MEIKDVIDVKVNIPESLKSDCIVGELGMNIDNMEVCFTMKQMRKIKTELEKLERQLKEANEVIKHYANDENWCDYYDEDDEKMTKSLYIECNGPLESKVYLEKWGVK